VKIYRDIEQGSDEWLRLRLGKITGTRLKSVLSKKADPVLIYEIVAEMVNPVLEDSYVSSEMQRGIDMEPFARRAYQDLSKTKIEEVGFVGHQKLDYSGYSPDGLSKTNGIYNISYEIKCPSTKTHAQYCIEGGVPAKYDSQILSAFFNGDTISDVIFISYDDRCDVKPIYYYKACREQYEAQLKEASEKVPAFWEKVTEAYNKLIF
jgi:hypothetical protein